MFCQHANKPNVVRRFYTVNERGHGSVIPGTIKTGSVASPGESFAHEKTYLKICSWAPNVFMMNRSKPNGVVVHENSDKFVVAAVDGNRNGETDGAGTCGTVVGNHRSATIRAPSEIVNALNPTFLFEYHDVSIITRHVFATKNSIKPHAHVYFRTRRYVYF